MNRKKFTLVELVVVVGIIALIAALLMPAAVRMINNAKKAKAKAEMNAIITAITSYESTYGVLPVTATYGWNNDPTTDYTVVDGTYSRYQILMQLLTGVKPGTDGTATTYKNVRNIRFLDVPSTYTSSDATVNGYRDPWYNYYRIYMDADYDGQITGPGGASDILYGTVFVYSTAGTSNNTDTVYSWKTKN